MATIIDELLVTLGLHDADFNKRREGVDSGLKRTREEGRKTGDDLQDFTKKAGLGMSKLRGEVVGLFLAFAGAKTVAGFLGDVIKNTAELGRTSSVMGVQINSLNAWGDAAKSAGGEAKDASQAFGVINDYFADFTRNPGNIGAHAMLFKQLGLSGKQSDFADPEALMLSLADQYTKERTAAEKTGDPVAIHRVQATFAQRLREFGITSDAMIQFIEKGRPAIERQISLYKEQDRVTQEDAAAAQEFNNQLSILRQTLVGLVRGPMTGFLKALNVMLADLTAHGFHPLTVHSDNPGYRKGSPGFQWSDIPKMFGLHWGNDSAPKPTTPMLFQGGGNQVASVRDYFKSQGWTNEQASGIAANLQHESALNPNAPGDSGRAYGVAQWHPDRQAEFRRVMGKNIRGSTLAEQLAFVQHELTRGNRKGAGDRLRRARTAAEAGAIVSQFYESPKDVVGEMRKRAATAQRITALAAHGRGNVKNTVNVTVHADGHASPHKIAKATGHAVKKALHGSNKVANSNSGMQ